MLLKNKIEIENWLNSFGIENYELIENKEYGYVVNVNDYVNFSFQNLKSIDVKFNIINGGFDCSYNELKSLEGCPKIVKGDFYCGNNQLNNLEYCPKKVKEIFSCISNKINNLNFFPESVGYFYLSDNNFDQEELFKLKTKIVHNYINLTFCEKLKDENHLSLRTNFNEIKEILKVKEEKKQLDLLISSNNINNKLIKINKI